MEMGEKVVLVVTTPDRPQGRGLKLTPTPVRLFAEASGLPVTAPATLKNNIALEDQIRSLQPDLFVVASYGKLIPDAYLSIPKQKCLNVHPSLLPKYRGASPIQWPILQGEEETGISIAEVTSRLDAGDVFFQSSIPIPEHVTGIELAEILAEASAIAIQKVIRDVRSGTLQITCQDETRSSYAPKLKKEDGLIDWSRSAKQIHNQVRALQPWPCAYTVIERDSVQILKTEYSNPSSQGQSIAGTYLGLTDKRMTVQTGHGILFVETLKPAGKKAMAAIDYLNGRQIPIGRKLSAL